MMCASENSRQARFGAGLAWRRYAGNGTQTRSRPSRQLSFGPVVQPQESDVRVYKLDPSRRCQLVRLHDFVLPLTSVKRNRECPSRQSQ